MKTEQIVILVVAFFLGMLLLNVVKNVCGCKLEEGFDGRSEGVRLLSSHCTQIRNNPINLSNCAAPRGPGKNPTLNNDMESFNLLWPEDVNNIAQLAPRCKDLVNEMKSCARISPRCSDMSTNSRSDFMEVFDRLLSNADSDKYCFSPPQNCNNDNDSLLIFYPFLTPGEYDPTSIANEGIEVGARVPVGACKYGDNLQGSITCDTNGLYKLEGCGTVERNRNTTPNSVNLAGAEELVRIVTETQGQVPTVATETATADSSPTPPSGTVQSANTVEVSGDFADGLFGSLPADMLNDCYVSTSELNNLGENADPIRALLEAERTTIAASLGVDTSEVDLPGINFAGGQGFGCPALTTYCDYIPTATGCQESDNANTR